MLGDDKDFKINLFYLVRTEQFDPYAIQPTKF